MRTPDASRRRSIAAAALAVLAITVTVLIAVDGGASGEPDPGRREPRPPVAAPAPAEVIEPAPPPRVDAAEPAYAVRVVSETGDPLVAVREEVTAAPVAGEVVEASFSGAHESSRTATTDESGAATFDRLPSRYVRLTLESVPEDFCMPDRAWSDVLTRNRATEDARFEVMRGATLVVTTDDSTDPGEVAWFYVKYEGPHAEPETGTSVMPPEGELRYRQLPPGRYTFRVHFTPASSRFRYVESFELRSSETVTARIGGPQLTGSLAGVVIGPDGAGIANAEVVVSDPTDHDWKQAFTDDSGRFRILGVPTGDLAVHVLPHGLGNVAYYGTAEQPYDLVRAPTRDLTLRMCAGCTIRGVVRTQGSIRPTAVRIDHTNYAGNVDWVNLEPGERDESARQFAFEHLRPGTYRLWIEGHEDTTARMVTVGTDDPESREATVEITVP